VSLNSQKYKLVSEKTTKKQHTVYDEVELQSS